MNNSENRSFMTENGVFVRNHGPGGESGDPPPPIGSPGYAEWKKQHNKDESQAKFRYLKRKLARGLNTKFRNRAVRNDYEKYTGQSAEQGTGPANLIRRFADIKVPTGVQGGTRKNKKSKNTRRKK
jgi:hypothetical protein